MNGYAACRDGIAATVLTRSPFSYADCTVPTPSRPQTSGTIRATGASSPAIHGGCAG
jgi:hypothetical protein